jgi:hypothetical protein
MRQQTVFYLSVSFARGPGCLRHCRAIVNKQLWRNGKLPSSTAPFNSYAEIVHGSSASNERPWNVHKGRTRADDDVVLFLSFMRDARRGRHNIIVEI